MRIVAVALLAWLALALTIGEAQARSARMVQPWTPTAASVLKADSGFPAGAIAQERMTIENFAPDIRFDPRDLDNSVIVFSASFMPRELPGRRAIDDDIRAQAQASFQSTKIQKKDDNTFEVHGFFRMNGQERQLIFKMNVIPAPAQNQQPALIFSGQFNAPVGNMASHFGLPAQIPVAFHVETVAAP